MERHGEFPSGFSPWRYARRLGAGKLAIHGFRNDSDQPASILNLFAPGAPRDGYFEGLPPWPRRRPTAPGAPVDATEYLVPHDL
ncbi:hypothetical protein A4G28_16545 [Mycobacterium ostraviense]|uniref:Uncharacterized protein n=1 Tax=Mycobacterium ostraviense TaxID=2738409 RepID=A0A162E6T9_9MYCO|nr:hypothetical protein A4G28_16545 [Mycobacterium ostraviense]